MSVSNTLEVQISRGDMDYLEYRIMRKDGELRWVDDYGHFTETEAYGGIFYVFISDITDKRKHMEEEKQRLAEEIQSAASADEVFECADKRMYEKKTALKSMG